jgi:hypothetical protein
MTFRKIQENTNWDTLNIIINHNLGYIPRVDGVKRLIPNKTARYYAKLLSICPLTENQEKTYFRLNSVKKIGFLSGHLIKYCKLNGVPQSTIKKYLELKFLYDESKRKRISHDEYQKRLKIYLLDRDYDSVMSMYMDDDTYDVYSDFNDFSILLINMLFDKYVDKIRITSRERVRTGERVLRTIRDRRKKKSYVDKIREEIESVNEDVTDLDKKIEIEVQRRLKNILDKKSSKRTNPSNQKPKHLEERLDGYVREDQE